MKVCVFVRVCVHRSAFAVTLVCSLPTGRHACVLLHWPRVQRWPSDGQGGHNHLILHLLWSQRRWTFEVASSYSELCCCVKLHVRMHTHTHISSICTFLIYICRQLVRWMLKLASVWHFLVLYSLTFKACSTASRSCGSHFTFGSENACSVVMVLKLCISATLQLVHVSTCVASVQDRWHAFFTKRTTQLWLLCISNSITNPK